MITSARPSKRALAAALAACALTLTACSPVDIFGPRPNGELVALARQAEADAASLDGPVADIRAFHAEQLYDDITRTCGVTPDGDPPATCQVERGPGEETGAADPAAAARALTDAAAHSRFPADSTDLVVAQAIDLAAAAEDQLPGSADEADEPAGGPKPITNDTAVEAATQLVNEEYAVQFGLDVASAFADDALQERIDTLRPLHDERIDALRSSFPELPPRAPGYEIAGGGPTNPAEAARFVEDVESNLVEAWRAASSKAVTEQSDVQWRELAIALAAHAQRAAR